MKVRMKRRVVRHLVRPSEVRTIVAYEAKHSETRRLGNENYVNLRSSGI
jgi:hypothetical protein